MVGFDLQRKNMVESQVRPSDVTDRRVISAMLDVPRELFVPEHLRVTAYMDQDLLLPGDVPGGGHRALLSPRLLARMIQHLEIGDGETVLEVGTATGYGAAILSRIAGKVVALESSAAFAQDARRAFAEVGAANVEVVVAPLKDGVPALAPFSAILISGSVPRVPEALLDQLLDGGRLCVVEKRDGVGRLMQWRRTGSTFGCRAVMDAAAPELSDFALQPAFVF